MPSSHVGLPRCTRHGLAVALTSVLATSACTAPNPMFTGPDFAAPPTTPPEDLTIIVIPDIAVRPPDLSPPVLCGAMGAPNGARACSDNLSQSGTCKGVKLAPDRDCPQKTQCQGGFCAIPPTLAGSTQGMACKSETGQCFVNQSTYTQSCVPFVVGKSVELHCAEALGAGAAGEACRRAADCRSGFCLGTGTCFRACAGSDSDCPLRNNVHLVCRAVTLNVEGVSMVTTSCVFP